VGLVLLMAVGSVVMWIGLPIALLYAASKLASTSRPTLGPILLVLLGLPLGMALVGRALGALDRAHGRLTRPDAGAPRRAPWLRSMRAERAAVRQGGVLDTVMIVSVAIALAAGAIWFFAFAGSSLPG
jgi:hypothetical protein